MGLRMNAGTETTPPSFWSRYRGLIVMGVLLAIFAAAILSGAFNDVDPEQIRQAVQDAGPWGVLLFIALFTLGELVHIPGMVFIAGGVLAYGRTGGFAVGLPGAVFSVAVSFLLVRAFGGQALHKIKYKRVQQILSKLDEGPVGSVFVLRSVLWLAPALNFALAMSRVRFRDYLLGSTLGLLIPIAGVVLFFEQALVWVSGATAG